MNTSNIKTLFMLFVLAVLAAFSSGSVLAAITYDFNSNSLQGWHNRVWDGTASAWVDLDPGVTTMPGDINGGDILPSNAGNSLFVSTTANYPWNIEGGSYLTLGQIDAGANTKWVRSPVFYLKNGSGDLTFKLIYGPTGGTLPANESGILYNASQGWSGLCLRDAITGTLVLSQQGTGTHNAYTSFSFTAAQLAALDQSHAYTLDLITTKAGGGSWIDLDDVSIPGTTTPPAAFFDITASAGTGGAISPSGVTTVAEISTPTYTITPAIGYDVAAVVLDEGTGAEVDLGAVTTYTFDPVTAAHTLSATFVAVAPHTVTASADTHGSISPDGAVSVAHRDSQVFTITPDSGFIVADVVLDAGTGLEEHLGSVTSHTLANVQADHTISATFAPVITYDFNGNSLQGWHNRVWDGTASAWVDLDPNVTTMPGTINGGVILPANAENSLFVSNPGGWTWMDAIYYPGDIGGGSYLTPGNLDAGANTKWVRSPVFYLNGSGDLTFKLIWGPPGGTLPANESGILYDASQGWSGLCLRDATTGAFVLSRQGTNTSAGYTAFSFTAAQLAALDQSHAYTLDLITTKAGDGSWIDLDDVSIPGRPATQPSGYAAWASTNGFDPAQPEAVGNDGLTNLMVYALDLNTDGTNGSPGTLAGNVLSFTKRPEAVSNGDVTYAIEVSTDLGGIDPWHVTTTGVTEVAGPPATISIDLSTLGGTGHFARLKVTQTP